MSDVTLSELREVVRLSIEKLRVHLEEIDRIVDVNPLEAMGALGGTCCGFLRMVKGISRDDAIAIGEKIFAEYSHLCEPESGSDQ